MYLVGVIIGTHGIKGEVKVKSDTSFQRFNVGSTLYLKNNDNILEIHIDSHRVHKNLDLIKFNKYNNINDVLQYVGWEVYTTHEVKLDENEYYYEDLIGLDVYSEKQELLGKVADIREVPQGVILEVNNDEKSFLVPFVSEFILEIDREKVVINAIEELIF